MKTSPQLRTESLILNAVVENTRRLAPEMRADIFAYLATHVDDPAHREHARHLAVTIREAEKAQSDFETLLRKSSRTPFTQEAAAR